MTGSLRQALPLVALAIVFGLCLSGLVNALLAGAIDSPVRGLDAVFRDSRPLLYWGLTAAYALAAAAAGIAAFRRLRGPVRA